MGRCLGILPLGRGESPFSIPDETWWAFSTQPANNLYYTAQRIPVGMMSGKYVLLSNNSDSGTDYRKGTLSLTITNDNFDDVAVKAFRFWKDEKGAWTLDGSSVLPAGTTELASFGTNWNVLYLLIENTSLTSDRSVTVQAYASE